MTLLQILNFLWHSETMSPDPMQSNRPETGSPTKYNLFDLDIDYSPCSIK